MSDPHYDPKTLSQMKALMPDTARQQRVRFAGIRKHLAEERRGLRPARSRSRASSASTTSTSKPASSASSSSP